MYTIFYLIVSFMIIITFKATRSRHPGLNDKEFDLFLHKNIEIGLHLHIKL